MSAFRMAGLLRLRKLKEDTAAGELAQRTAEKRAAERQETSALERLGEHRLDASGGATAWMASVAARSSYTSAVDTARAAIATAADAEREAQLAYARAKKDAKTLEKLETKHVEAERAEDERKEQLVLDELATQRAFKGEGR